MLFFCSLMFFLRLRSFCRALSLSQLSVQPCICRQSPTAFAYHREALRCRCTTLPRGVPFQHLPNCHVLHESLYVAPVIRSCLFSTSTRVQVFLNTSPLACFPDPTNVFSTGEVSFNVRSDRNVAFLWALNKLVAVTW